MIGMTRISETYRGDAIFLDIIIDEVEFEGNILPLSSPACLAVMYESDDVYVYNADEYTDEDRIGFAKSIMYGYGFYEDEENPWWLR